MARVFTGLSTARVDYGDDAALRDRCQGSQMLAVYLFRRGANTSGLYLSQKSTNAATRGWGVFLDTTSGFPRFQIGGATQGNVTSSVGTTLSEHTIVMAQYDSGAAGVAKMKLFQSAVEVPITESTYSAQTAPVTPGTDSGDTQYVWNSNALNGSLDGDGGFYAEFTPAAVLTLAEKQRVQLGLLTLLAGIQAGSAAIRTRGVDLVRNVVSDANIKTITYLASDGTLTDYAPTPLTAITLTGSTSAGVDKLNVFAPISFWHDVCPDTYKEQTLYRYTGSFAETRFLTDAISARYWWWSSMDPVGFPREATLDTEINGDWVVSNAAAAVGQNSTNRPGLFGGMKKVGIINGARRIALIDDPHPWLGSFLQLVVFPDVATVTEVAPTVAKQRIVMVGQSSITEGYHANTATRYAAPMYLRRAPMDWADDIASWSTGTMGWYTLCRNATVRAESVAILTAGNPRAIVFDLHTDQIPPGAPWSTATATPEVVAMLNEILALFTGKFYFICVTITTAEANTNAFGETLQNWRDFHAGLPALISQPHRASYHNAKDWILTSDLFDTVHPDTVGYQKLNPIFRMIFDVDPGRFEPRFPQRMPAQARFR